MTEEEQKSFGQFLVEKKKLLSAEDLKTCQELQIAMRQWGIEKTLDKVILEKGLINPADMTVLLREYLGGDESFIRGYRIVGKLGEGAMGEVYKAIDLENDNRLVAIKVLYPYLSKRKATAQRFLQEAEICIKKLHHAHIVKGYEVGYEVNSDCYFYVMELIDGKNLRKLLQEKGPFPEATILRIMVQITAALEHAAEFKLVHRDIKPDNIMLTREGIAKLCDLGLARDWGKDLSLTRTGAVMGTPFYISPEAASGIEQLDSRSDIYSLGASVYHLAVGHVPFSGANANVVLSLHISAPLVPPIELRPDLSPSFSKVVEKMMAKSPEDRYQTPTQLMEDLKRLEAGQPPDLGKISSLNPTLRRSSREAVAAIINSQTAMIGSSQTAEIEYAGEDELPAAEAEVATEEYVAGNVPEHEEENLLKQKVVTAEIAIDEMLEAKQESQSRPVLPAVAAPTKPPKPARQQVEEDEIVEKYVVEEKESAVEIPIPKQNQKQESILSTFFTSGERHALSQAKSARSKLLLLGAVMGGIGLVTALILGYIVIYLLKWIKV